MLGEGVWSLSDRQWQTLEGFLVGQCHDQRNALGHSVALYMHSEWKMPESRDRKNN